jgi:hypothetical protein
LAKVAVQCSADTFVGNQSLVLRINISGENRHLSQAENRQAVKKPNFNIYLQKNNAKISLEFASACLPESIFQTAIFC